MKVREFYLLNEKGQKYSFMDLKNYCFLTEPSGLGYSYSSEYERIGSAFIEKFRKFEQGKINGILNFRSYDNYKKFVDFVESATFLKFVYKVPFEDGYTEYFKDIDVSTINKTEKRHRGRFKSSCDV